MKKSILFALILGGTLCFTSCASDEECVCSNATYTQSDADDAGSTLNELCTVAKIGDSSCAMK